MFEEERGLGRGRGQGEVEVEGEGEGEVEGEVEGEGGGWEGKGGEGGELFAALRSTAGKPCAKQTRRSVIRRFDQLLVTGLAGGGALTISSLR